MKAFTEFQKFKILKISIPFSSRFSFASSRQGWIHRALHASSSTEVVDLAFDQHDPGSASRPSRRRSHSGKKCPQYVNSVMRKCELLMSHGVTPFLVLDGAPLPSKCADDSRRRSRQESFQKGLSFQQEGNVKAATAMFARSVGVTNEMKHELVQRCQEVRCVAVLSEAK